MVQKTIVWDIDGVLIWHHPTNPENDWRRILIGTGGLEALEGFQKSPAWEKCLRDNTADTRRFFADYVAEKNLPLKTDIDHVIQTWLERNIQPSVPAIKKLKSLLDEGHRCAIGTNQDGLRKPYIKRWLDDQGLGDLPCFMSCDMAMAKPDAEYFLHIQKELNEQPEDMVFLDDKQVNVDSAIDLGWRGIHVNESFRETPEKWNNLSVF